MSREQKLLNRLLSKPKDYTWAELSTLLKKLGYEQIEGSGSRVKFYLEEPRNLIMVHKPHPSGILKAYQIKDVINNLNKIGATNENDEI